LGLRTAHAPRSAITAAVPFVAPFVIFVALRWLPFAQEWVAPVRLVVVAAAIALLSWHVIPRRPSFAWGSILLGVAVFAVWIGPDLVWPGYRDTWLFHNVVTGAARSSLPAQIKSNALFISIRILESAMLVPILEELFWRGWFMRWLIRADFESVPIGRYTPWSFWVVAVLFASEHGPYWDVGLIAGIAYNWWTVRTRSLADCIFAHAVTNALLAGYVLVFNQWQYWL